MAKLDITWSQFQYCNDNQTAAFEEMCRRLFTAEFLKNRERPHTNHNTPGIEVEPILEAERDDGQPRRRISFQAKYVGTTTSAYSKFKDSATKTVQYYKGKLDLVYLFCNQTLTTTSMQYQGIVSIHKAAGIVVVPISNVDLLDMIKDNHDIADYYFEKRKAADSLDMEKFYNIFIDRLSEESSDNPIKIRLDPSNTKLVKKLISEKLAACKEYAVQLELEALENELQSLFSCGINSFEGSGTAYFYSLLVKLYKGEDYDTELQNCGAEYVAEAEWIIEFNRAPKAVSIEDFESHFPAIQIFIINKLFSPDHWSDILALWEGVKFRVDPSIKNTIELFYALSLFNLQQIEKSKKTFDDIVKSTEDIRVHFFSCLVDIRMENSYYQAGMAGNHEKLIELLSQLNSYNNLKQAKQQSLLISALKMESFYHLGIAEKKYLECAIDEFNGYSEETKGQTIVRFFYALCLELNGQRDKAIVIYSSMDWKFDPFIAERYMLCLILNSRADEAISVYGLINNKTSFTEGVYLFALKSNGDTQKYNEALTIATNQYSNSLEDTIKIAYFIDSDDTSKEIVLTEIKRLATEKSIQALPNNIKINLIIILSQFREITLLESVLKSIIDPSAINEYAVGEIYKALFDVTNRECKIEERTVDNSADFESAERIADNYLRTGHFRKYFLQIKILCAGARQKPFSSLKYSKELFAITHDENLARNIVALLLDRKEKNPSAYAPYLEILKSSEKPECCIAVASANIALGKIDEADYYAYRSLYFLNGKDDYKVYKSFFCFCNYNIHRYCQTSSIKSVNGGAVITLTENAADSQARQIVICLDAEAELSDEGNRSMGIEHLNQFDHDYIKLHCCGLNQVIKFRGKHFKMEHIVSRVQYGFYYVFQKIQEKPELFQGSVFMISTADVEGGLKKIRELTDNTEQINSLLNLYHQIENDTGIPLDLLVSGDYSRYIDAVKYLLFYKDEAFYAGKPVFEDETGQRYIPSLSTLVLLSVLGRIDVLDSFKQQIIIPESYLSFIQEEYSKAVRRCQRSPTSLAFVEDRPIIQETDKTIPDLWEMLLDFCNQCVSESISDQERIDSIIANETSGEQLFSDMKISYIHLDALILSKKENATFLCDDLFFRRLATWMEIRNINTVSLIWQHTDSDYYVPIIKELSKTNYIYVPFLYRNINEMYEVLDNLLEGEKKNKIYGEILRRYFELRDQLLKAILGDNNQNNQIQQE